MTLDPHIVLQYACAVASASLLLFIVIRGIKNGKRRVWFKYSIPGAVWFLLAGTYSLARILLPPNTPLPFDLELIDAGWLIWLFAIGTIAAYIIDGNNE